MSERTKITLLVLVGVFCVFMTGLTMGHTQGRAEMKRWQDQWYAAHPAVKEVPPRDSVLGYVTIPRSDYEYMVKQSYQQIAPAPKPSKAVTLHLKNLDCSPDPTCKSFEQYVERQAKPSKGSTPHKEQIREMAEYHKDLEQWRCPHRNKSISGWQMSDDHVCTPPPPMGAGFIGDPPCTLGSGSNHWRADGTEVFDDTQSDCVPEGEKRRCFIINNFGTTKSKDVRVPCEPAQERKKPE